MTDIPYVAMKDEAGAPTLASSSGLPPEPVRTTLGVPKYTVNDEPTWMKEASPTDKMRLKYESLDYDEIENYISLKQAVSRSNWFFTKQTVSRWLITLLIGLSIAIIAFAMNMGVRWLTYGRFYFTYLVAAGCHNCFWKPFFAYVGSGTLLIMISSAMAVLVEPVAGGSGIGEIKCYLNGVKVPHVLRLKTLLAKLVGTMFSVSAGLAVGPEGPMIHLGAITAAGVSQGKSTTFHLDSKLMASFRNDREKRDFINGGAACGMAAALGSPIGGTLFTLEEGASFWNQALTWRTFFCSMIGSFIVNLLLSGVAYHDWGALSQPGLVNFGTFSQQKSHGYTATQLPFFIMLGAVGGLIGAAFNYLNKKLTIFRLKHLKRPPIRYIEAVSVALVTSTLSFVLSYYFHKCARIPTNASSDSGSADSSFQFFCPAGYYNDMATIFFASQEDAIKQLLHNEGQFAVSTLVIFAFVYFSLACWTFGVAIPSGLFVPSLVTGAAIGRLGGRLIETLLPSLNVNPGTFALIGAAAILGGKTRMTISLTVILLESTNDMTYGFPLMVTLMVAKWVGDWFNPGIYDVHIELREIPLLEWEPDPILRKFKAHHVMASPVLTFSQIDRVSGIYWALKHTSHNGFPILDKDGVFCGLMLRSQLLTLLKQKAFTNRKEIPQTFYQRVTLEDFGKDYPRFGNINQISLQPEEFDMFMDLRPYMSCNLFLVQQDASMMRVFRLFRSMGLRHLIVVNKNNNVVGMISRKDLVYFEEKLRANQRVGL